MPAWITSLLRDEVTVPMPSAASRTMTSRPACASRRATARPITPAPMTTQSTLSIGGPDRDDVARLNAWPGRTHGRASWPPVRGFRVSRLLIMQGQLPQFEPHFSVAGLGVYPIQTPEA